MDAHELAGHPSALAMATRMVDYHWNRTQVRGAGGGGRAAHCSHACGGMRGRVCLRLLQWLHCVSLRDGGESWWRRRAVTRAVCAAASLSVWVWVAAGGDCGQGAGALERGTQL